MTPYFLVLRRRTGLSTGAGVLIETLHRVRERGLDRFRRLHPASWPVPTRCDGWSVHDVARHLVQVAESRDPAHPGPEDLHASTWTPDGTRWAMEHAIESEYRTLLRRAIPAGDQPDADGWHWSLQIAHRLWDAWHHERDVCHALGLRTRAGAEESRLVALYSLLHAARTAAEVEGQASFRLKLTEGVFAATADPGDALATFGLMERPATVAIPTGELLDALAGRGPELATLMPGHPDLARQLEYARRLTMTGATARPIG